MSSCYNNWNSSSVYHFLKPGFHIGEHIFIPDGVGFCHYIPVARHEMFASASVFHFRSLKCPALSVGSTNYCSIITTTTTTTMYRFIEKSNIQITDSFVMPL